ncbi:redoxin domain-containing protein [Oceanobacillus sp. 143]|uniref:Thiol:disulfide interchange protein n=1 Tax=Oceanobacillus zhaokaii TaxID=2052660 RepID=A0A345PED1_9BACI|nr:redoxin domain-containing protein [Oceanobacillus zhaokaii]AXI08361.1 thiol:disulfide interchange protein [Oceanobacillus zhaokaii]QGS68262.1 redoxin domain-containing protein [Oceanobacillus sp. 143]
MVKKIIIMIIFVTCISCIGFTDLSNADDTVGTEIGNIAPDFEIQSLDGERVKLKDLRGKRVMLNFWATWCPPCRVEMPDMQKLHENEDIIVLAVNLTDSEMSQNDITTFVNEFGLTFPVGLDKSGEISKLYKINPIPTTFMIDSDGIIRFKLFGAMSYNMMTEELEKMD